MITLNKDLAKRIIEVKELDSYISTVVDYYKEEEYSNKYDEVVKDIIEVLFPLDDKQNELIVSAYSWIGDTNKIDWIINNVLEVPSSRYFYDKVDNLNDNYIISTVMMSSISYLKNI